MSSSDRPSDPANGSSPSDGSLVRTYVRGDTEAGNELYRRYADRIRELARNNLAPGGGARLDADDVVQSVFRQFFLGASEGRYHLPSGEELWGLFLVMTLNRLRSDHRYHRAEKRNAGQTVELIEAAVPAADDGLEAFLAASVDEALGRLAVGHRELVRLRMEGFEVAEIAAKTGRRKRTVERMLQEARVQLRGLLGMDT